VFRGRRPAFRMLISLKKITISLSRLFRNECWRFNASADLASESVRPTTKRER
jgi:hypothetical protein